MALTKTHNRMIEDAAKNVKDFGAVGDGVADDTAAFTAAIASFSASGGDLILPIGIYKITSTIRIDKPINVIGFGEGSVYQPVQTPATKILWAGVATTILEFGGFGTLVSGGGLKGLMIDGAATATTALHIKDSQRAAFSDLTITGVTGHGLLMQNTVTLDPTGFHIFDDLRIQLRGGATNNANGITVDGSNSGGAEGVTLCTFRRCRIDHANGVGVLIRDIGDFFHWESLQTFRADVETGVGVWFDSTSSSAICSYHTFDCCNVSAGWRFDKAGIHTGTRIINAGQVDINSGAVLLFGAGASDVRCDTGLGFSYGQGLLPDLNYFHTTDRMNLIRHDTSNNVLHTADGNWLTALVGSGSISGGGQAGTTTRLTTGSVTNNSTAFYDIGSIGADGISTNTEFALSFSLSPITTSNVDIVLGAVDQNTTFPNNGIYFKYLSSSSPNWIISCVSGGTATNVNSGLAVGSGLIQFYVFKNSNGASFYYRTVNNRLFSFIGTITTNIPTAKLNIISRIETLAASAASIDIYGVKLGVVDEVIN